MSLSSPFGQWLGTNYTPSAVEVSQIAAFLEEPRSELAALGDEVNEALRALNTLLAKQARLKLHIEAHEALTHPIRRLPDELLVEVFHHCLPTSHRPVMSNASAPLLLTRVCHPWRELALSAPTLWSSLHIPIPKGRDVRHHLAVTDARDEGVKWWLANAKDALLSIYLYWPPTLMDAYDTDCQLLKTVLHFSQHLRVLELNLPDSVLLEVFLHGGDVDLPALNKVILRLPAPPDRHTRGLQITHTHLWKAPNIKRLVWESVDDDFFKLPLNWENMEEIVLESDPMIPLSYVSPLDARALIFATPNLQRLRLELTIYDQSRSRVPVGFPASDNPIISMNHLTHLDITDVSLDPDIETSFLQNLQLPALTSLTYHFMGLNPFLSSAPPLSGPSGPMHPLLAFLHTQAKVMIKSFKVGGTSIPRDAFVECLWLMPSLEKLYVTDPRLLSEEDEYEVDVREPVSDDEGPAGRAFPSLDELLATQGERPVVEETGVAVVEGYGDVSPPARKRQKRAFGDDEGFGRSRTMAARRREISPDDDLLKAFIPSDVWWKTSLEDVTWHRPRDNGKGKGKERETAMDVTDSVFAEPMRWDGSPMVIEGRRGVFSAHDDEDVEMETEGVGEGEGANNQLPESLGDATTPPTAQTQTIDPTFLAPVQSDSISLRVFPVMPDSHGAGATLPEPLGDTDPQGKTGVGKVVDTIRISVPIPVDTTDLAAEEREVLCPRLTSLRFDRARVTVTGLRTFIKARTSLNQASDSRKGRASGWELVTEGKRGRVNGEEIADEVKGDGNSTGFFTANASPSGVFSKEGLSREASTSADALSVEHLNSASHRVNSWTNVATVAPMQDIQAGIMYTQPVHDLPPPRLTRREEGSGSGKYNSRLAAEMREEFNVRVVLRFASVPILDPPAMPHVWGAQGNDDAFQAPGTPRWAEGAPFTAGTPRWGGGSPVGVDEESFEHVVVREGRLEERLRNRGDRGDRVVGVMTAVNDARVGVRGWAGPGSLYEEEEDHAGVWQW